MNAKFIIQAKAANINPQAKERLRYLLQKSMEQTITNFLSAFQPDITEDTTLEMSFVESVKPQVTVATGRGGRG